MFNMELGILGFLGLISFRNIFMKRNFTNEKQGWFVFRQCFLIILNNVVLCWNSCNVLYLLILSARICLVEFHRFLFRTNLVPLVDMQGFGLFIIFGYMPRRY